MVYLLSYVDSVLHRAKIYAISLVLVLMMRPLLFPRISQFSLVPTGISDGIAIRLFMANSGTTQSSFNVIIKNIGVTHW